MKEENELSIEDVEGFIESCSGNDLEYIIGIDRIENYISKLHVDLQEEIDDLKEDYMNKNVSYDELETKLNDVLNELYSTKGERDDLLENASLIVTNYYDSDKSKILQTAFKKYTLDELMEKLNINWLEVE